MGAARRDHSWACIGVTTRGEKRYSAGTALANHHRPHAAQWGRAYAPTVALAVPCVVCASDASGVARMWAWHVKRRPAAMGLAWNHSLPFRRCAPLTSTGMGRSNRARQVEDGLIGVRERAEAERQSADVEHVPNMASMRNTGATRCEQTKDCCEQAQRNWRPPALDRCRGRRCSAVRRCGVCRCLVSGTRVLAAPCDFVNPPTQP